MPEAIDPSKIPGADIQPDVIEEQAGVVSGIATGVRDNGSGVAQKWQGMAAFYSAPESPTLLGLMEPVSSQATTVGDNLDTVSAALVQYAADVRPIKQALDTLRWRAELFRADIANGVEVRELNPAYVNAQGYQGSWNAYGAASTTTTSSDIPQYKNVTKEWHEVQSYVDRNNELISAVNEQQVLLWEAERACANKIRALYGAAPLHAATTENDALGYGIEEIPDGTEMPWGASVERTEGCGEATFNFVVKDFLWEGIAVGGVWGTIQGLGTLVLGYNPADGSWFSGDAYGAAWGNLGMLAAGAVISSTPPLNLLFMADDAVTALGGDGFLPDEVRDFKDTADEAWLNTGKALIAWDKWEDDPGTALGESVFNVGTLLIPVGGAAVAGVKTATTATAVLSKMARVVDLIDPAALAINGTLRVGGAGLGALDNLIGKFELPAHLVDPPHIEVYTAMDSGGALNLLDDFGVDMNTVTVRPGADGGSVFEFPGGAVEVPAPGVTVADNGVRVVDGGTDASAPVQVREPELVNAGGVQGQTGPGPVNSIVEDAPVRTDTGGTGETTVIRDTETTGSGNGGGSGSSGDGTGTGGGSGSHGDAGDGAGAGSQGASGDSGSGSDSAPGPKDNAEGGSGIAGAEPRDATTDGQARSDVEPGTALSPAELDDLAKDGYHVAFFDRKAFNQFYDVPSPKLGPSGGKFWVMPLEDGAFVRDASDAYRATGASPAATRAYIGYEVDISGNPVFSKPVNPAERDLMAVIFEPTQTNPPLKPVQADSGGWPHYLDSSDPAAGHTAVLTGEGPNAGYLTNPHIREFVINGGDLVRPGSLIAKISDGVWTVEKVI